MKDFCEKKVLITGGSGFIGSKIKEKLYSLDIKILTIGHSEKEDIKIDLNDSNLKSVINDFNPDLIFHFASGSNIQRANEDKEKEFKNTVKATKHLIKCLNELKTKPERIFYLSSQAVYGLPKFLPVNESHPINPVTTYGNLKLKAEQIITSSNLNYFIFRLSSVFGKGQDYSKSGAIAKFINKLKNNEPPIVFNSLEVFSDYIYLEDLIYAIIETAKCNAKESNVFNLGSGKPTTLANILNILYKYFPSAPKPQINKSLLYFNEEQKGLYLDIEKIKKEFNWSPKYNVEDGLKEMLKNMQIQEKV